MRPYSFWDSFSVFTVEGKPQDFGTFKQDYLSSRDCHGPPADRVSGLDNGVVRNFYLVETFVSSKWHSGHVYETPRIVDCKPISNRHKFLFSDLLPIFFPSLWFPESPFVVSSYPRLLVYFVPSETPPGHSAETGGQLGRSSVEQISGSTDTLSFSFPKKSGTTSTEGLRCRRTRCYTRLRRRR